MDQMLKQLHDRKIDVEAELEKLETLRADIVDAIRRRVEGEIADFRRLTNKETGTATVHVGGFKISETISKRVEWDQDRLVAIRQEIVAAGSDPDQYMRAKFDIPEKEWEKFDAATQAALSPARTVKPGKPSIKIEEE